MNEFFNLAYPEIENNPEYSLSCAYIIEEHLFSKTFRFKFQKYFKNIKTSISK